jgi:hypothetical protein
MCLNRKDVIKSVMCKLALRSDVAVVILLSPALVLFTTAVASNGSKGC